MAKYLNKVGNKSNRPIKYFICDSLSDLSSLTGADIIMGTKVYVIEEDKVYVKDSDNNWIKQEVIGTANKEVIKVVQSYNDLLQLSDAAEGALAYVRNDTVSGQGAPIDLTDCPNDEDVIRVAYEAQGGEYGDSGWYDYLYSYTNCYFEAGRLKLATPTYRDNYEDFRDGYVLFGVNYDTRIGYVDPVNIRVVGAADPDEEDAQIIVADHQYNYMPGFTFDDPGIEEITENGITKYRMLIVRVYAYEAMTGVLYHTDIADGHTAALSSGWNDLGIIGSLDGDGKLTVERVYVAPTADDDLYLPEISFWAGNLGDEETTQLIRGVLSELIYDTQQSTTIPPALYIRTGGEWRKLS